MVVLSTAIQQRNIFSVKMNLITWHLTTPFIWQNLIYPYLTYPDLTKIVIMTVKNLLENNIKVELILSLIIHTNTRLFFA